MIKEPNNPIDPEEPYQPTSPDDPDVAPPLTDDQKRKLNEKPPYQAADGLGKNGLGNPPGVQKITRDQEAMQTPQH